MAKITNNEQAFEHATNVLVGGVNSPARAFRSVGGTPVFIASASGATITSIEGKRYLDLIGSWGPMILGHRPKVVMDALFSQMNLGLSYGAPTLLETQMAKRIISCVPSIEKVRMVSSGTEAALSAARLARGATNKPYIIKFQGCYHGHADSFLVEAGSGAATLGVESSPGVPVDLSKLTLVATYNDLGSVEQLLTSHRGQVAGIFVEPVAGNMGLVPPQPDFLPGLRDLADKHEALLVFDEVMSGFRLSLAGAQGLYDVTPDLTCLGKIIGGGLPAGAYGGSAKWMDRVSPVGSIYQAGTLSGNPLATASGLATLDYLYKHPETYASLEKKGAKLENGLNDLINKHGIGAVVQRLGSMITLFFSKKAVRNFEDAKATDKQAFSRFFHEMLKRGYYFPPSQYEAAFLSDAITQEEIVTLLAAADEVLGLPEFRA